MERIGWSRLLRMGTYRRTSGVNRTVTLRRIIATRNYSSSEVEACRGQCGIRFGLNVPVVLSAWKDENQFTSE